MHPKLNGEIVNILPRRGVYTLIIFLTRNLHLKIGKLGAFTFLRGYYAYTGSAFGPSPKSLHFRVLRHLRRDKLKRWHIDFLLASRHSLIKAVIAAKKDRGFECGVNQLIMKEMSYKTLAWKFGASDCNRGCKSHLLFLGIQENIEYAILEVYRKMFINPSILLFI